MPLFIPKTTLSINANTGSQTLSLGRPDAKTVRVQVVGAETAFVKFSEDPAVTVSTSDGMPIAPGAPELFGLGNERYVAAVTATGTTQVCVTLGWGEQ